MKHEEDELDRAIAVEAECEAQLAIIRSLKPLNMASRQRVMCAAQHLIAAEALVGGVLSAIVSGLKTGEDNRVRGRVIPAASVGWPIKRSAR